MVGNLEIFTKYALLTASMKADCEQDRAVEKSQTLQVLDYLINQASERLIMTGTRTFTVHQGRLQFKGTSNQDDKS